MTEPTILTTNQEKETDGGFVSLPPSTFLPTLVCPYTLKIPGLTWGWVHRHSACVWIFVSLVLKWQRLPWWKFTNKWFPIEWSLVLPVLSVSYRLLKPPHKDVFKYSLNEKNKRFLIPALSQRPPYTLCKLNNHTWPRIDDSLLGEYFDQVHKQKNKTTDQNKQEQAGLSIL